MYAHAMRSRSLTRRSTGPLSAKLKPPRRPVSSVSYSPREACTCFFLIKLLHITAVIAFVGNITTGIFWHAPAARTRDPKLLAYTMGGIIRSDRLFTIPTAALLTPLAGLALMALKPSL